MSRIPRRSPVSRHRRSQFYFSASDTTIDVNFCRAGKDPITVSVRSKVNSGDVCVALASENWRTEGLHEGERSAGRM